MSATAQRDALALEAAIAAPTLRRTARVLSAAEARVALAEYARERALRVERERLRRLAARESLAEAAARRCATLDLSDAPAGAEARSYVVPWAALLELDPGPATGRGVAGWLAEHDRRRAEADAELARAVEVERGWRAARRAVRRAESITEGVARRCATLEI